MNILIIGCGKVGSRLACVLDKMGHAVSLVDRDVESFNLLDDDFSGLTVVGVPIDQDVLRRAGIEGCDAMAAVTHDDNVNIMASELAKVMFKVPRVVARLYDPKREDVFSEFGLNTVCPTNLTVNAVCSALTGRTEAQNVTFSTATVSFTTIRVPSNLAGHWISDLPHSADEIPFAVQRANNTMELCQGGTGNLVMQKDDRIILSQVID